MQIRLAHRLQCIGVDGRVIALAPRDAAVLAWLALEGPTSRVHLAQLMWPDSAPESARNALRQRLFQLRRQLGVDVIEGQATLALAPGIEHDLHDADDVLADLGEAIGGEFGQWLAHQRSRRKSRVQRSLAELADMAERAHDFDDALGHAAELLALEPLSEEAHRRVMRLHYLAGNRATALLAFDHCERVLKDEVGARPSADTLQLLATIESGAAAAPADAQGAALPASVARPPRLIGRDGELAALAQAWEASAVVAVIGEAGLGKTRLLQEFAAGRPGVVRAAGRPGDAGVPFATLARLLRAATALSAADAPLALPAATRHEIARALPEFDAVGVAHPGEGQRMMLLRAVRALLAAQPTLVGLIVDDLHFADDASLEMLASLCDDDTSPSLRWALGCRPVEPGSAVQTLHDGLVEQARLAPVTLAPLDAHALTELVDSLALPGILGSTLAPGLLRRTGGNPLFVLETLKQAWVERTLARLADAKGQWMPRPVSVGRLIERRVAQLSPPALALARVASIAGVDSSIALAEQVLGVSAMQFADALNELEAAQVLRGNAFAHDLVFEAVLDSVPATIAAHTHGQVAQWLQQHGGEPARVAGHWIAAGQESRALPWLQRAAVAAGVATRRKEQIAFLEQCSAIQERAGDRAAAFESQMRAAELQVTLDGEGDHTVAQCDRLDRLAVDAAQAIRARLQRAHLSYMRGDVAQAEQLAATALRDAQRSAAPPAVLVGCRQQLAVAFALLDRNAEAIVLFEANATWIDEHADTEERCDFHGNLALAYDNCGRLADAVAHHELALTLAQQAQHHGNMTMCLNNFAANRILGGQLRDGEALLSRARQLCAGSDEASSVDGFIAMLQAICDYQSGRFRAALRALADSDEQLGRFAPGFRASAATHLAVCWTHLGQWSRLQRLLDDIDRGAPPGHATALRLATLRHRLALALGRPAGIAALEAALQQHGSGMGDMRHLVEIEVAGLLGGAPGLARLEAVAAEAQALGHGGTLIAVHARAARVAAGIGEAAAARRHVQASLHQAERSQVVRQYPAEHWLDCADALARIGDSDAAQRLIQRGAEWVRAAARDEVPQEFRSSFLNRNPVNAELLARAARRSPA